MDGTIPVTVSKKVTIRMLVVAGSWWSLVCCYSIVLLLEC
jgi:hypothetical protein